MNTSSISPDGVSDRDIFHLANDGEILCSILQKTTWSDFFAAAYLVAGQKYHKFALILQVVSSFLKTLTVNFTKTMNFV
jgi:hypothetical protein